MPSETHLPRGAMHEFAEIRFDVAQVPSYLLDSSIREIVLFALGPTGTNIEQAAKQWATHRGVSDKATVALCPTPEDAVWAARQENSPGVLPVFVLCAVYNRLHELYFSNPDCMFFLDHHYMPLDQMQLVANQSWTERDGVKVFVHPSPAVLLSAFDAYEIVYSRSNSDAANACAEDEDSLCITTETSRAMKGLRTIHRYGSPYMLFTFGTTPHGMAQLERLAADQSSALNGT